MALGGGVSSGVWFADRQDPVATQPLQGAFPIAFWAAAVLFAGGAIIRRNPERFTKPVNESNLSPLRSDAYWFSAERADREGTTTQFICLVTSDRLQIWTLGAGPGIRVLEVLKQGLCPVDKPAPNLDVPLTHLQRIVQVSDSTLIVVYQAQDGRTKSESLRVTADAGQILTALSGHGWLPLSDPNSQDLRRWAREQNLFMGVLFGTFGAAPAGVAMFPSPWALPAALSILVAVPICGVLLASAGSMQVDLVVPPNRQSDAGPYAARGAARPPGSRVVPGLHEGVLTAR